MYSNKITQSKRFLNESLGRTFMLMNKIYIKRTDMGCVSPNLKLMWSLQIEHIISYIVLVFYIAHCQVLVLKNKTLCQKMPCTWIVEHEEIKAVLKCKLHPHWLCLQALKGVMSASCQKGKMIQSIYTKEMMLMTWRNRNKTFKLTKNVQQAQEKNA